MKNCCIVGLGYIGLPTAALLAEKDFQVIGVDINQDIVLKINNGEVHIIEPGLEELVKKVINNGSFKAQQYPDHADVFLIAVPTPFKKGEAEIPEPDLSYVFAAAEKIAPFVNSESLIIIESTCPVGATQKVASIIESYSSHKIEDINIAYCPERVIPGKTLIELVSNDRVIGGLTKKSSDMARNFYKTFCKGRLFLTNSKTAELVKLTENSYRDVNIAFANELSVICDNLDINVWELVKFSNFHPRVNILNPGCGVGGHCIAVDPWFIASAFPSDTKLIQTARYINSYKTNWIIDKVSKKASILEKKHKRPIKICCMGLAFKPNVDDLRESPAEKIALKLLMKGLTISACEPNINTHDSIKLLKIDEAIKNSDMLLFLVPHKEFFNLKFENKEIIDFCGLYS